MAITANDPFRSAPRISRDEFRRRINMHAAPGVIALCLGAVLIGAMA